MRWLSECGYHAGQIVGADVRTQTKFIDDLLGKKEKKKKKRKIKYSFSQIIIITTAKTKCEAGEHSLTIEHSEGVGENMEQLIIRKSMSLALVLVLANKSRTQSKITTYQKQQQQKIKTNPPIEPHPTNPHSSFSLLH